jgi:hypothetical protein
MSKLRAALTHLGAGIPVLALIAALVLFAWYPGPLLEFQESGRAALLLIAVAFIIGPVLTLIVYSKGKRGLLLDLCVIALVQLMAMGWGTFSLYQNRPYFMVYTVDRFEVFSLRDIDPPGIIDSKFLDKPITRPILLYANMPDDPQSFQKLLQEVMFEGKPDLQFRPEYWSLYATKQKLVLAKSQALSGLRDARPDSVKAIDRLVKNHGGDIGKLVFVPGMMKNGHFAAILDSGSGEVVDTLKIDPWLD